MAFVVDEDGVVGWVMVMVRDRGGDRGGDRESPESLQHSTAHNHVLCHQEHRENTKIPIVVAESSQNTSAPIARRSWQSRSRLFSHSLLCMSVTLLLRIGGESSALNTYPTCQFSLANSLLDKTNASFESDLENSESRSNFAHIRGARAGVRDT